MCAGVRRKSGPGVFVGAVLLCRTAEAFSCSLAAVVAGRITLPNWPNTPRSGSGGSEMRFSLAQVHGDRSPIAPTCRIDRPVADGTHSLVAAGCTPLLTFRSGKPCARNHGENHDRQRVVGPGTRSHTG